jgi:hypothetical protein
MLVVLSITDGSPLVNLAAMARPARRSSATRGFVVSGLERHRLGTVPWRERREDGDAGLGHLLVLLDGTAADTIAPTTRPPEIRGIPPVNTITSP